VVDLIWTESALHDLDAIADDIFSRRSGNGQAARAKGLQTRRSARKRSAERFCPAGTQGNAPYRHLVISPLRLFFRTQKDAISIIHIMRGERQFHKEDILEREGG